MPVLSAFFNDWTSHTTVTVGPVGSGKSYAHCAKVLAHAMQQPVCPRTNIQRSRYAMIRNTSEQLKTTTIKTYEELMPPEHCGPIRYSSPIRHRIRREPRADRPGFDCEIIFMPLDHVDDVRKLRSLELTGAFINEGSEVPRPLLIMARRRVGRYPKKDRHTGYQAWRPAVWIDTNATDQEHYLYAAKMDTPHGWKFYVQPPAVLECKRSLDGWVVHEPGWQAEPIGDREVVFAGGRYWCVNPGAENLANLIDGYYETQQLPGSKVAEIQRDLQSKFVFVQEGEPVIEGFNPEVHVRAVEMREDLPLIIGADIGGGTLNPAGVIAQRLPRGVWLILDEVAKGRMGVVRFVEALKETLAARHFRIHGTPKLGALWGDPAAAKGDDLYEVQIFDHMIANGFDALPVDSNDPKLRIEAIEAPMGRMIDGAPGILIHPRCRQLIGALSGRWQYKRVKMAGTDGRLKDAPEKTHPWSDLGDALGYLLMGGGETAALRSGNLEHAGPWAPGQVAQAIEADYEFDLFD